MDNQANQDNNQNPVNPIGSTDPVVNPVGPEPVQVQQPITTDPIVQPVQPGVIQPVVSDPTSQLVQDPIASQPLISQEPAVPAPLDPQPIVQPIAPDVQPVASEPTSQQTTAGQLTQQQEDAMVDMLMDKVFARVGQMLTEEEMKQVEELDKTDFNGEAVRQFLQGKGIDIDKIMKEEMEKLKEEASNSTAGN